MELSWEKLENARAGRIAFYTGGSIKAGGSELDPAAILSFYPDVEIKKVLLPRTLKIEKVSVWQTQNLQ